MKVRTPRPKMRKGKSKSRGIRVDKAQVERFVKRSEKAHKAALLAQGQYVRQYARDKVLRRRIAISKKPRFTRGVGYQQKKAGKWVDIPTSQAVSRKGDPPWTYRHKGRGNLFRRIHYGLYGSHVVLAGSAFVQRAKGSRATTPSLHEHGGTLSVKQYQTVLVRDNRDMTAGKPYSSYTKQGRTKPTSQAQRMALYHAIHSGRVKKKQVLTDSFRATYPKRPFMRPAGEKSIREPGFRHKWTRAMQRSLGTY